MQKWEYCVLIGTRYHDNLFQTNYPAVNVFTIDGTRRLKSFDEYKMLKVTESSLVEKAIFQLGEEGWEMVSGPQRPSEDSLTHYGYPPIWFKRPKP